MPGSQEPRMGSREPLPEGQRGRGLRQGVRTQCLVHRRPESAGAGGLLGLVEGWRVGACQGFSGVLCWHRGFWEENQLGGGLGRLQIHTLSFPEGSSEV
jgi:hypothetical protein